MVKKYGLFKTLGWWHDTWALNEEKIDEGVFLEDLMRTDQMQADFTLDELKNDPPSLLVSIFTGTDSASHMFYRLMDPQHPRYDAELAAKYGDSIQKVYQHMDQVVGDVERAMKPGGTLIIVSDHGFHTWRRGFNTNTWLVENGYMTLKNPGATEKAENLSELFGQGSFFPNVDWSHTRAYALGLGQIYLNLRGREKEGILDLGPGTDKLLEEIRAKLKAFQDPDTHQQVLENVYLGREIFHGAAHGGGAGVATRFSRWLPDFLANLAGRHPRGNRRRQHEEVERRPLRLRPQRHSGNLLHQRSAEVSFAKHRGHLPDGPQTTPGRTRWPA